MPTNSAGLLRHSGLSSLPTASESHWQTAADALFQVFLATLLLTGEQMVPFICSISTLLPKPPPPDLQLETRDCRIPLSHAVLHLELLSSFSNVISFSAEDEGRRICQGCTQVSLWGLFTYTVYLLKKASLNWTPTNPIQIC